MFTRGGTIRRWAALWVLAAGALFAWPAEANTFADTCTGCHANNNTSPPFMPSQDATFGKIMKDTGQFTDECLVTTNCVLRQRLKGEDALGNIINVNARNNMDSLGEGVGSFTNAELEAVRLYLLKVRDLVIANPSPAFSFPSTLTTGNNSIASTVAIQNWRGTSVSYAFTLVGTNPGDYSITAGASGSCAATSSLAAPNNCNANVTVRFSPTAGGSRPATLRMTFTVPGADPIPFTRDFSLTGTGVVPAPIYQGSTSSLNFSARLGSSVNNSMTITNSAGASANLVLSAFNYSAPQYTRSVSSTCTIGISLAPGASCTLTTTFTPGAAGAQNGSLSIVHNAAGSPDAVTLTGTGTQSLISPTSSSLAFGNVQQGVPKPLNLVVSNTGTATLNFTVSPSSPAAKTGAAAADYAVTGTCILGTPLAALGGTCTLTVTLTPSAQGARPATLTISSDATNGPLVIALSGTGVALPEPVVTPPASDFPDTVISQTSAQTRTVTIQNDRVRTITYAVSDTTDFKIGTESCPTRVVPGSGGVCTIAIQFMPTLGAGEGRRTAALAFTFTGEAPDPNPDPVNVNVAGNALLPLAQSATSLNAAAVVGSPTTTSMLLTNRSASPITLTSLLFSGTAATDYSLAVGNTCTPALVLAPSSSCTLVVGFNPPAAGTRNATLTITHSAAGSPQTVAFLGTATPAPQGRIELSSSTVAYADTQLASTSAQTITVHNGGNLALNFSAFTFGGTNPADFQRSGTCAVGTPPWAAQCGPACAIFPCGGVRPPCCAKSAAPRPGVASGARGACGCPPGGGAAGRPGPSACMAGMPGTKRPCCRVTCGVPGAPGCDTAPANWSGRCGCGTPPGWPGPSMPWTGGPGCVGCGPRAAGPPGWPAWANWRPPAAAPGAGPRHGCGVTCLPSAGRSTRSDGTGPRAARRASGPAGARRSAWTNAPGGNARVTAIRCRTGAGGRCPDGAPTRPGGRGRAWGAASTGATRATPGGSTRPERTVGAALANCGAGMATIAPGTLRFT